MQTYSGRWTIIETKKEVTYDFDGYEIVTDAIDDLLKRFPGLEDGERIEFSKLGEDSGFGWFPAGGAIIESERISITDHVTQKCLLPFFIVYRSHFTTSDQKKAVKSMLDNIGRWLEQQEIIVNESRHRLDAYPKLSGEREIEKISRKTPAYLDGIQESGCEDWAISIVLKYKNEYDK